MKMHPPPFAPIAAVLALLCLPAANAADESKTSEREATLRGSSAPESRRRPDQSIQVQPKEKRVSPYADSRQKEQVEKARQQKLESKSDKDGPRAKQDR